VTLYRVVFLKLSIEKDFERPSENKMPGGKDAKAKWMGELNRIRKLSYILRDARRIRIYYKNM